MRNSSKWHLAYLEMARIASMASTSNKRKVGCIIVKNGNVISIGINGTPCGYKDNTCEDKLHKTHWYTLHAEANAITKLAKSSAETCEGSTLYCTDSPCLECAKLIVQAGIKEVFFSNVYFSNEDLRSLDDGDFKPISPIDFLTSCGINIGKAV